MTQRQQIELERLRARLNATVSDAAADLIAHESAGDPHPTYLTAAEGNATYLTPTSTNTLTNKTISDFSNFLNADEIHFEVRNVSGIALPKGVPVYITGYNPGQERVTVGLADASLVATMPCIGLTDEVIANNANGSVDEVGHVTGVDTSAFAVGDWLYVSETAGALTATPPVMPAIPQVVGYVLRSHASLGVILVTIAQAITPTIVAAAGALLKPEIIALTPTTGAVTIDMAVSEGNYLTHALSGAPTYSLTNMVAGRTTSIHITCDATLRALTFPAGWVFVGAKPTDIAASKVALLTLICFGVSDADVLATYSVQT